MLDRKPAPLRAYGLDKTSHMRAAAKCLREIGLMMLERSKQIKEGKDMAPQEHVRRVREALQYIGSDNPIGDDYSHAQKSLDAIERNLTHPDDLRKLARDISTRLIAHTTSVHNVEEIACALQQAYNLGKDSK